MNQQRSLFHDTAPTLDEVMSVWDEARPEWWSRAQIAEKLGRSKSPALIATIGVCVAMGFLTIKNERLPNGSDYFMYQATPKWFATEYPF